MLKFKIREVGPDLALSDPTLMNEALSRCDTRRADQTIYVESVTLLNASSSAGMPSTSMRPMKPT